MEELIARQIKHKEAEEVTELVLDNARCSEVNGLSNQLTGLCRLSIVNAGLISLKGFPSLPNLKELQLGDNKLSGGLEALAGCPKLSRLGLAGNKFGELEDLKPLRTLTTLVSLDLYNCPITSLEEYRSQVFQLLTSLQYLDGVNEKGEEMESEGEEDGEGAEEEEEEEEPGLDYLLNNDLASDSEEGDYDPDKDEPGSGDDEEPSEEEEDGTGAGPSSSKRPKLDEPQQEASDCTDSD